MARLVWLVVLLATAFAAGAQPRDRTLTVTPKEAMPGEARHALVIGNSAYANGPLRNPVNDARAMAKALGETGFTVELLEDATQPAMQRAIRRFGDQIAKGGVGLFYYAGHGIQARGRNYLIPVNAEIVREDEVEFDSVDVNLVLAKMDSAKNALNIVILDACRNNPFARNFRSMQTGLAQMDAPTGTFIAFATAPGSVAADGAGENGIYTKHLLTEIDKPGLPIEQLFKHVRVAVMAETRGHQIPWESSSLRGEFAFRPGAQPGVAEAVAEAVKREREAHQREMEKLIQAALERQRKQLEAQGVALPEPAKPAPAALVPAAAAPTPPAGSAPTVVASIAPPSAARISSTRFPQPGDNWTYQLTEYRRGERPMQSDYTVKVAASSDTNVLDHVSRDGAPPIEWAHSKGNYMVAQVVSVFSPYLAVFEDLTPGARIWRVAEHDDACFSWVICSTVGKIEGRETVQLPAGTFDAIKVRIEQSLSSRQGPLVLAGGGSRSLTIWYSPQAKRAVKVSSRATGGSRSPFHASFDLELVSYQVQ